MNYKDAPEELGKLAVLLQLEKKVEEDRLKSILANRPIKERKAEGLTWYPVQVVEMGFLSSGQPHVTVERTKGDYPAHQFQSGSPVFLYRANNEGERYKAILIAYSDFHLKLSLQEEDLPDGLREDSWVVESRFDDRAFFEMERALNVAINLEKGDQKHLRDVILGYKNPSEPLPNEGWKVSQALNASQTEAVINALTAAEVAVVHGPPGTGKTTTLVEIVRLEAKTKSPILVCAPSNAAVDHLTAQLGMKGLKVVRLGHPARLSDEVMVHALDTHLDKMPEMKTAKDLRKRAADAKDAAGKFKRSFGAEDRVERKSNREEARAMFKEARELERWAEQKLIGEADAVTCTLVGASDVRIRAKEFELCIIDEAGQSLEPSTWIPILKTKKLILAGDPHQLSPTVKSEQAAKKGLSTTILDKVIERTHTSVLLKEQYRMNAQIMSYSNTYFYENELIAHATVVDQTLGPDELAIEFIDTAGCGYEEEFETEGSSKRNPEEARLIMRHYEQLKDKFGGEIKSVGMITPYRAQLDVIRELTNTFPEITVQTVDGFQGQERDVIYISLVRSNTSGQLGFLTDYRRMNVAMTRAMRKLVVVGDSATLGNDPFFSGFLEYIEDINAYRSAWEWME
ncbi:MAG: ATP-dependent RNA/DNA helicase IGHMBP2 [Flavobacteriales bacterium]|jgi:ATP-dependent RNA/DNA helicase IGHMBP2